MLDLVEDMCGKQAVDIDPDAFTLHFYTLSCQSLAFRHNPSRPTISIQRCSPRSLITSEDIAIAKVCIRVYAIVGTDITEGLFIVVCSVLFKTFLRR